jgi:deoxyribonuclease-4
MLLGAHESIAGGVAKAFARGMADTAKSIQIFTKNARGWRAKPLADEEVRAFRSEATRTGLAVIAHCTYLVNLGSEETDLREKSLTGFADELTRCHVLGIPYLVVHPGANPDLKKGIALIAKGLDESIAAAQGTTAVLLEVTAGQGASIGYKFEHLADILERTRRSERVAVCLDTCHLYASGYDIARPDGWRRTLQELDRTIGLARVKAFHLNDCKKPLGSRLDRHEEIGDGTLGLSAFRPILEESRFAQTVGVLETPTPGYYRRNLQRLRSLLE